TCALPISATRVPLVLRGHRLDARAVRAPRPARHLLPQPPARRVRKYPGGLGGVAQRRDGHLGVSPPRSQMMNGFFDLGGTVRARSARDTLAQLAPLLPRFGITRLVAQEGLAGIDIPVTICFRPNARGYSSSQGK